MGCACVVEAFETMETSPLVSPGAVVEDVDFRGGMTGLWYSDGASGRDPRDIVEPTDVFDPS